EFKRAVDSLLNKKGMKKDEAIFTILQEYIKKSRKIRFEGDGYSADWVKEAERRGLSNNENTPEAIKAKVSDRALALFDGLDVMNPTEIKARHEVELADYIMH